MLTTTSVFFFKEGSPQIVDLIPLREVDSITLERITGTDEALENQFGSNVNLLGKSGRAAAPVRSATQLQKSGSAQSVTDATGEIHFRRARQSINVRPANQLCPGPRDTGIVEKDPRNFVQLLREASRRDHCESVDESESGHAIVVKTSAESYFQGRNCCSNERLLQIL